MPFPPRTTKPGPGTLIERLAVPRPRLKITLPKLNLFDGLAGAGAAAGAATRPEGAGAGAPVPVTGTVEGDSGPSLGTVSAADFAPTEVGAKTIADVAFFARSEAGRAAAVGGDLKLAGIGPGEGDGPDRRRARARVFD